ncbi:DUF1912 family protein [Streptococcus ferus]|uniref:DUF1912 family protein n=1 Tax=Streptococcus ferus TaxID=1345 RepID=UPI00351123E7
MSYEADFLKEFEAWVNTQVAVNEMAVKESQKLAEESQDDKAADAYIRYESKLDAYRFLQGKFANYHAGRGFHDLPEEMFGKRSY